MYRIALTSFVVAVVLAASLCMTDANDAAAPVDIVVYYESMCPFCRKFINTQLYPTFLAVSPDVLNVTLIPFGFGRERQQNGEWQFSCQHGPVECVGNRIATCALNLTSNDPVRYLTFINCMEHNTVHGHEMTALTKCASADITEADVTTCLNSPEGGELQHEIVSKTHAGHIHYTPWIVVNGVHTNDLHHRAYTNLLKVVCETYTGQDPAACKAVTDAPGVVG